ncbi:response regulator [Aggregicoccus sp. 17bor-14]|uniref:response regulator n=1 Tax=Myxococcaceae TaxID=31 RepID=UPI00129CAF5F|nr:MULTISPECIES: response regulator [Myxococcaceae]MBF5040850.1 response regulator [Simulacricoccus sp. 17bor-14]MRI86639.1 response regulator [Aggregicoccus sp. 17bor-14]
MKVLLVEDDAGVREGLSELVSEQATVHDVGSVPEALAALRAGVYDLVLTDLRIGGDRLGGRTILEAARGCLVPVAIMSASVPEEVERTLAPLHPDAQLTKPFQLEDVFGLVERFLALRTRAQQAGEATPAASGWEPHGAQAQRLREPHATWLRLAPGARLPWPTEGHACGVLVVEGELELNGQRRGAAQYFYVSADGGCEAATREGCLAVSLPLAR